MSWKRAGPGLPPSPRRCASDGRRRTLHLRHLAHAVPAPAAPIRRPGLAPDLSYEGFGFRASASARKAIDLGFQRGQLVGSGSHTGLARRTGVALGSVAAPRCRRAGALGLNSSTQVARAFGIYNLPGSMGPFSTHSLWLIDRDGVIRFRQVSLEMHVPFDEVERTVADTQPRN